MEHHISECLSHILSEVTILAVSGCCVSKVIWKWKSYYFYYFSADCQINTASKECVNITGKAMILCGLSQVSAQSRTKRDDNIQLEIASNLPCMMYNESVASHTNHLLAKYMCLQKKFTRSSYKLQHDTNPTSSSLPVAAMTISRRPPKIWQVFLI